VQYYRYRFEEWRLDAYITHKVGNWGLIQVGPAVQRVEVEDPGDKDRYIEPNEIIEGHRFIAIPNPLKLAYRLEVEVASIAGFTWRASHIVDKSSLSGSIGKELVGL